MGPGEVPVLYPFFAVSMVLVRGQCNIPIYIRFTERVFFNAMAALEIVAELEG
jgi:hypothetical protein